MSDKPASGIAPLYLWLLALLGLVLIFVSTLMPHETEAEKIFHEFVKELGIVLFAVLTISLLYEMFLAKKYHAEFLGDLREEIRKGESNAAACAHLGIDEIFPERGRFTSVHSLDKYARAADADAVIRIFGRSTHNLLSDRAHIFTDALSRGARMQLCILDPSSSAEELKRTQDVWPKDLPFALWNLREQLIPNIERERPEGPLKGTLEVRFHRVPMLDSFL
ncbi:MAG TPA: hypothetical protein VHK90_08580, partial [Thermoanaerobaculia bacterium]|nr:hypothetical protein [Thermoanaerobaculia bacterium]